MQKKINQPPRIYMSASVQTHKTEELISSLLTLLDATQYATGNCRRGCLFNPPHYHAQVTRFHHDSDTLGFQDVHDGICYVFSQTLLDLQSPGEHIRYPRQLRNANNVLVWDIANVHLV